MKLKLLLISILSISLINMSMNNQKVVDAYEKETINGYDFGGSYNLVSDSYTLNNNETDKSYDVEFLQVMGGANYYIQMKGNPQGYIKNTTKLYGYIKSIDLGTINQGNIYVCSSTNPISSCSNGDKLISDATSIYTPLGKNHRYFYVTAAVSTAIFEKISINLSLVAPVVVNFNSDGGTNVDSTSVFPSESITQPISPTKDGYSFAGWYKEKELINAWNFDTDFVLENTTLYAKWELLPAIDGLKALNTKASLAFNYNFSETGGATIYEMQQSAEDLSFDDPSTVTKLGFEGLNFEAKANNAPFAPSYSGSDQAITLGFHQATQKGSSLTISSPYRIHGVEITTAQNNIYYLQLSLGSVDIYPEESSSFYSLYTLDAFEFTIQNISYNELISISSLVILCDGPSYSTSNMTLRLGTLIPYDAIWSRLENIQGYGVAVMKESDLLECAASNLNELFSAYSLENNEDRDSLIQAGLKLAKGTNSTPVRVDQNLNESAEGENVIFSAKIKVPTAHYNDVLHAQAYVIINGEYVLLNEKICSIKSVAQEYLDNFSYDETITKVLESI